MQTPNNGNWTVWRQVKFSQARGMQRDQATRTGEPYRGFMVLINGHRESIALEAIYVVTNDEPLRVRIAR